MLPCKKFAYPTLLLLYVLKGVSQICVVSEPFRFTRSSCVCDSFMGKIRHSKSQIIWNNCLLCELKFWSALFCFVSFLWRVCSMSIIHIQPHEIIRKSIQIINRVWVLKSQSLMYYRYCKRGQFSIKVWHREWSICPKVVQECLYFDERNR